MMKRFTFLLFLGIFLVSCLKDDGHNATGVSGGVSFYVYQPDAGIVGTRAAIEDTGVLREKGLSLYVTDLMGFHSADANQIEGTEFMYDGTSGLWSNADVEWEDRIYEFYAYVMSNPPSASETNGLISLRSVGEAHPGRYIDIYQPMTYSASDEGWADYLLSYRVEVDGTYRPLVRLELERVTAGVELYVSTPEGSSVRLKEVVFRNVVRCARMSIAEHAVSTATLDGRRNKWVIQSIEGKTQTTDYLVSGTVPVMERTEGTDRFSSGFMVMRFLTVPQDIREDAVLSVSYEVEEGTGDWKEYNAEFPLRNPSVYRWDIGHKTRYYVGLDTSVELEGVVEEWNNMGNLAGTFLPDIESE